MDITHYTFAFYVFILVCGAILLLGRVLRSSKKNEKGNYDKEQRLFKLYQNVEDMMTSFEEYVEEAQAKIDESYNRVLKIMGNSQTPEHPEEPVQVKVLEEVSAPIETESTVPDMVLDMPTEKAVSYLLQQGFTKEEIAKQLGISNREVTLIMGLKKMKKEK